MINNRTAYAVITALTFSILLSAMAISPCRSIVLAGQDKAAAVATNDQAYILLKKDFDDKYAQYVQLLNSGADQKTVSGAETAAMEASKAMSAYLEKNGIETPEKTDDIAVEAAAAIETDDFQALKAEYEKKLEEYAAAISSGADNTNRSDAAKKLADTRSRLMACLDKIAAGGGGKAAAAKTELEKLKQNLPAGSNGLRKISEKSPQINNAAAPGLRSQTPKTPGVKPAQEKKNWFSRTIDSVSSFFTNSYDALFGNKYAVKKTYSAKEANRDILIIGHAGSPMKEPDNTLAGFERAYQDGANMIETDIGITSDGQVVHMHDWDPDSLLSRARQAGLQGFKYRPWCPNLGNKMRKPVNKLTLEELRANYGYTLSKNFITGKAPKAANAIPTLEEFTAWLAARDSIRYVYLDVKIPANEEDLVEPMLKYIDAAAKKHGVSDKLIFFSPNVNIAAKASEAASRLGINIRIGLDMELPAKPLMSLDPSKYEVVRLAGTAGYGFASIGRPTKITVAGGWKTFMNIAVNNLNLQAGSNKGVSFICWTINEENEIRELIEIGADGIMSDDAAVVKKVLKLINK